ncbi:hypothetical protein COOONC_05500 [Cooperia oncophora]
MYYNASKGRPLGCKLDGSKLLRKTHKSWEQLRRHDPDVEISDEATEHLFVSNSSVLCGVSLEELEDIFLPIDPDASFTVYPNKRSYSFVSFSSKERASAARESLNGVVPSQLKVSHQPFLISYVKQLPRGGSPDGPPLPNDLVLVDDYVTAEQEEELLNMVLNSGRAKSLKHRAVVHYGYEFDYSANAPTDSIPDQIARLRWHSILNEGLLHFRPDQSTFMSLVKVFPLTPHHITHYDGRTLSPPRPPSLCSDVVMEFKDGANSARICPVLLKRRSLCLIKGESRYRWKHGIVNRKHDINPVTHRVMRRQLRVSITLRKTRHERCQCPFKEFCDWDRGGEMAVPSDDTSAERIERLYVNGVYESIASHFDETRFSSWAGVKRFLNSLPDYSLVYDVGCGNGKYLVLDDRLCKVGCDMSQMLCEIAGAKGCMVVRADGLFLPFREGADAVLSIAVLHHMAVLKVGGRACITVWSMDQNNSEYSKMRENKDSITDTQHPDRLLIHDGKDFIQQDMLVPWRIDDTGETFLRYYHVFAEGEMEELLRSVDGCRIDSIEKEQGNYIAVITKVS